MDAAWDALDTNPMTVALHSEYAKNVSSELPTLATEDDERNCYYIKGFHDLHCLVCHQDSRCPVSYLS
jgi:hypothetical protein